MTTTPSHVIALHSFDPIRLLRLLCRCYHLDVGSSAKQSFHNGVGRAVVSDDAATTEPTAALATAATAASRDTSASSFEFGQGEAAAERKRVAEH